ncbi:cardiolipin synthase [Pseudomonas sp. gcc21]|uniref:cardiolipin synthase n=1 Tax=Pseudomonas sp. gcc21 TaxID=2726989 RepID=UPI00145217B8|nr:cardiolipin synthase [Pseudomonas sp. gcc21]QJD58418.1 cardiolipin synthase [Pseudomonas sp. gcc21]
MDNIQSVLGIAMAVMYWLLIALVTARVIARRKPVSVTLAWLLVIFIVPILGAVLYLLVGDLNLGRKRASRAEAMVEPYLRSLHTSFPTDVSLPGGQLSLAINQLLSTQIHISAQSYQSLDVLDAPEAIFDRLCDDVRRARHCIRIETYIWYPGGRVDELAHALIEAVGRGVKIYLLIDHAGSRPFFRSPWHKQMKAAGIEVTAALPVRLLRALVHRIDLRMHRKLIVIDDAVAYTGSMNIADPAFFKRKARVGPWIDIMLRIDGQAAAGLAKVFAWDWEVETGQRLLPEVGNTPDNPNQWLMVLPSGPGVGEDLIGHATLTSIYRANHSIVISTPYFVPSETILEALCQAAHRGVKVQLLLPRRNDSLMVGWASRSYFEILLQAGVEIFLFDGGLLHTKAMLMDEQLALVGSVNLDIRSLQLNFELTVALTTPESCAHIRAVLDVYQARSEQLLLSRWQQRSKAARGLERLMYFMSPLL